jgi:uncharacterized Zn finger protein (UPF0148 family)
MCEQNKAPLFCHLDFGKSTCPVWENTTVEVNATKLKRDTKDIGGYKKLQ